MIYIKNAKEIEEMRKVGRLAAATLDAAGKQIKIGMSTEDINTFVHNHTLAQGATPAPLNYRGFPKSVCTSKNDVICHGIPSSEDILEDGDIINIDVTTLFNRYHGDTSRTFLVGNVKEPLRKLVQVTHECMMAGISVVRPGARLGDIGAIISGIAKDHGYSVVREYCGHGIGRNFHEDPQILHYGKKGTGMEMRPGMIFTVEPMINLGKRDLMLLEDDWTVVTQDGKHSAQFEHTVLVCEEGQGHEILTPWP